MNETGSTKLEIRNKSQIPESAINETEAPEIPPPAQVDRVPRLRDRAMVREGVARESHE